MPVPRLRFKDAQGKDYQEWEETSFRELTYLSGEKNKGDMPYPTYSISNSGGFVSREEQFGDGALQYADKTMYKIVEPKSFAYNPARINVGSIGYQNLDYPVIVSSLYIVFKTVDKVSDRFLWHWFHAPLLTKAIRKFAEGGVRSYYFYDKLCDTTCLLPSFSEQEKIADFLTAYDRMIEVQAERVEAMKTRKKGLLQKIFSRKIRFKDAQGKDYQEWEVKSVEDLADDIIGGGTPSTKNSTFYTGDIPWVSSSDLLEDRINYLNITRFITQEAIRSSATKLIPAKSVMIVSRVGVGKVAINTVPLCTSQDFMNLVVKKEYSTEFVAYLLMNLMLRKKNSVQGTAIKGIPSAEIRKFEVLIPTLSEQEKIADFLTAVDTQIEVEEKRLETMRTIKKGLLQQMFV